MDAPYGKTIRCECGRIHEIEPREVYAGDAAARQAARWATWAADGERAALVADRRTYEAAGRTVAHAMQEAAFAVDEIILSDGGHARPPVCDEATHAVVLDRLGEGANVVLAVGSGVISDVGKWAAFERGLPLITVATAASMNGYTLANVAPTIGGLKSLVRARPPRAVLADPRVIRDAPYELTTAGLGDALAKTTSATDWRLNHLLFGDYYCPASVALTDRIEPLFADRPETLADREPVAIAALLEALMLTGVAMTMAESSAPASGGEHMVSHTLDMLSSLDGHPHDLHGRQVGVGTILACELYRRVLAVESPELCAPAGGVDESYWGPLAPACRKEYSRKLPRYEQAARRIRTGSTWDDLRAELAAMVRPPERIRSCLERARGAVTAADVGCDRDRLLAALLHGHEARSRFTVLDLARMLGVMPGAAEEIVH